MRRRSHPLRSLAVELVSILALAAFYAFLGSDGPRILGEWMARGFMPR
jgi:hypothetical protein